MHLQELSENMGLKKLRDRFLDDSYSGAMAGLFPKDNPKNTRFAINFFTSIGLGALTYVSSSSSGAHACVVCVCRCVIWKPPVCVCSPRAGTISEHS